MKLTDFPSVVTEYYTYLEGKEPYSSLKNLANCLGDIPYLVGYFAHCEVCICKMGSTIFVALSMSLPSSWLTMTSEVFMSG